MSVTSTSTAASTTFSRDETGRLFGHTMGLVALTAGVFALGAYLGRDLAGGGRSSSTSLRSEPCSA